MFRNILILLFVVLCGSCGSGYEIKDKDYDLFDETTTTTTDFPWDTNWPTASPRPLIATKPPITDPVDSGEVDGPTPKPPTYVAGTQTIIVNIRNMDQVDCGMNRNKRKKCVSWYLCQNSSIVTDGAFLIDERMDTGQPNRNLCPSMETCCGPEDQLEIPDYDASEEITTTTARNSGAPGRGRPSKKPVVPDYETSEEITTTTARNSGKPGRGKPSKKPVVPDYETSEEITTTTARNSGTPGRGKPSKKPVVPDYETSEEITTTTAKNSGKPGRGKPSKKPVVPDYETSEEITTTARNSGKPGRGRPNEKPFIEVTKAPSGRQILKNDCKTYSGEFEKPKRCGARNVNGFGKKLESKGDKYAQYGEFPWMMAILTEVEDSEGNSFWKYKCGGSLIHSKVVVTAAHSLFQTPPSEMRVRGGEWDAQSKGERCPVQEREVHEKSIHDYNPATKENNILLLVLKQNFQLTAVVNTLCLPASNFDFGNSHQPDCYATGWGSDTFGVPKYFQNFLKRVKLPVVPRTTCLNQINVKTLVGGSLTLTPTQMCAGGEAGKDMCTGDGGSPLACKNPEEKDLYDETYYLAGIVTAGVPGGCGQANMPGIYEEVTKHMQWIKRELFQRLNLRKEY